MKVRILAVLMMTVAVDSASAADSYSVASDLGDLLASERVCGLTYKQEAIEQYVRENVDEADLSFTRNLSLVAGVRRDEIEAMPTSERAAHCTQVKRAAVHFGFTN